MRFRDLQEEWHPTLNLPLVYDFSLPKYKKYSWICNKGHIWEASLAGRKRGKDCSRCYETKSNKSLLDLVSFGIMEWILSNPEIASQWHPTDNADVRLLNVADSSRIACWICVEGHEWEAAIANRMKGSGCPVCEGIQRLADFLENYTAGIISEWHPTKNGRLSASNVADKLTENIWWICTEGHEWESSITKRTNSGCKVCSGEILVIGVNDLRTTHPYLAAEWNPSKNYHEIENVTAKSEEKYWWREACGIERKETPRERTTNYSGCVLCTTRKNIATEWHPTKNRELTLEEIPSGSEIQVWCQCRKGHEWTASFSDGTRKGRDTGCVICFNEAIFAADWHPTRNTIISLDEVNNEVIEKCWWICSEGHEWEMSPKHRINIRTGNIAGCPVCLGGRKLSTGIKNLASENPVLAAEWHPTKNGSLKPEYVAAHSDKKVWWLGSDCGHEWEAFIKNRAKGYGCGICFGYAQRIHSNLTMENPELAAEWHPTKNGNSLPHLVNAGSVKKVWWLGKCGHEWKTSVNSRNMLQTGCPVCSNKKVLTGYNDLKTINPALALEWHPTRNGNTKPEQVIVGSTKKVWWLGKCGHEWEAAPCVRKKSNSCPVCRKRKVVIGVNDLATVNPLLAAEWHPTKNQKLTADKIHNDSGSKVWWKGLCNHSWATSPAFRARGRGCPLCESKEDGIWRI